MKYVLHYPINMAAAHLFSGMNRSSSDCYLGVARPCSFLWFKALFCSNDLETAWLMVRSTKLVWNQLLVVFSWLSFLNVAAPWSLNIVFLSAFPSLSSEHAVTWWDSLPPTWGIRGFNFNIQLYGPPFASSSILLFDERLGLMSFLHLCCFFLFLLLWKFGES